MTETVFPKALLDRLRPEAVSALVGWLAHESCYETKGLFEIGAGYVAKLRWERTCGYHLGRNGIFAPEEIAQHWNSIVDFTDAEHPTVMNDSLDAVQRIMADDRRD
jgi:3-hydroxyacyl-CoA dehydrogenase/3a,7a,12a-trihydroxy-5b-cholest-24-enoyl-CoA hydratase